MIDFVHQCWILTYQISGTVVVKGYPLEAVPKKSRRDTLSISEVWGE